MIQKLDPTLNSGFTRWAPLKTPKKISGKVPYRFVTKDRRGGPTHLINRAVEKQEFRLTEPKRPGEVLIEDTVQLRGDGSGLEGSQQGDFVRII
ncbi:hypothetical protein TNCV_3846521 [Trichonephila clavipes]|nr:hypothetical protein TNCV_3846521 [Trichonephila clavipes]